MRIAVVGTGYLGATHAACLASWGHEVVGLDRDEERIQSLRSGQMPFHEPGLEKLISGPRFTTDPAELEECEVFFLCVGTPEAADGSADLSAVDEAMRTMTPYLTDDTLVVGKSTVPVGTAARLAEQVPRLAWNPEFLREGSAVEDTLRPERLVFGVTNDDDLKTLNQVYAEIVDEGVPVVVTDLATAELAKQAANLLLATRISVVNLLSEVCERARADVADLVDVLGLDSRIGTGSLRPGIGYGGGCLPKDSRAFAHRAGELGVDAAGFVDQVDAINQRQQARAAETALAMVAEIDEPKVAVLGAAFKAGTDDIRTSPAMDVTRLVADAGPRIAVYDPRASRHVAKAEPSWEIAQTVEGACADADAVMVLTDWPEFRTLDPFALGRLVRQPKVLDGRHMIDPLIWRNAGWDVTVLGRPLV